MSEWKECKLGNVCVKVLTGGTPLTKKTEYYVNGKIPWLRTKEVNFCKINNTENYISELGLANSAAKLVPANSVIVAMYGQGDTAGRVAINKIPLATNQACCNLVIDNGVADYQFIYYLLKNSYFELVQRKTGSAQPNLNTQMLKDFDISLPPLPEQCAIASILSSLDDKIDLLHRQNKTLEALAETLFRQWFVEEAEEGWGTGTLGNVITVKGGTTPSTKEPRYWNGNVYWTSPRDLSNHVGIFLFDTNQKITEEGLAQIGSGLLPLGTVLLSSRAPIGYLAITDIPVAINQGYIGIVCDKNISNYFIYLWCKQNMELIKNAGNGSVFQEISKGVFKELDIIIPPKEQLNNFDIQVNSYFQKIRINQIQIRLLTRLRDTLLPKLMSGEVRVKLQQEEAGI